MRAGRLDKTQSAAEATAASADHRRQALYLTLAQVPSGCVVSYGQLAALVLIRIAEEQRRRKVGADAMGRAGHAEDGIVDMIAVTATVGITVETWRQDLERQRSGRDVYGRRRQ